MKMVIDANYLQDPSLEEYFRADRNNKVVFTDYACMEAYKGDAIRNIYKSLQIVSRYPDQVIVLKPTSPTVRVGDESQDAQRYLDA
jgi:hypothetical protein